VSTGLFGITFLVPLAIAGLTIAGLKKQGTLITSIALFIGLALGLVLVLALIPFPEWVGRAPLDRLSYLLDMTYISDGVTLVVMLAGLISFISLVVYAFRNRDLHLGLTLLLTVLFIPLLVGLGIAGSMSDLNPPEGLLIVGVFVVLTIPIGYILRSTGFVMRRQFGWALPALAVGLVTLLIPAFALFSMPMGGWQTPCRLREAWDLMGWISWSKKPNEVLKPLWKTPRCKPRQENLLVCVNISPRPCIGTLKP
jgi:hypothetical protein